MYNNEMFILTPCAWGLCLMGLQNALHLFLTFYNFAYLLGIVFNSSNGRRKKRLCFTSCLLKISFLRGEVDILMTIGF